MKIGTIRLLKANVPQKGQMVLFSGTEENKDKPNLIGIIEDLDPLEDITTHVQVRIMYLISENQEAGLIPRSYLYTLVMEEAEFPDKLLRYPIHPRDWQWIVSMGLIGKEIEFAIEQDYVTHPDCLSDTCQETKSFIGTPHEGVCVCDDGCVWGKNINYAVLSKIPARQYSEEEVKNGLYSILNKMFPRIERPQSDHWFDEYIKKK